MALDNNKRIAVNSIIIFIRLCIVSLVSILASRLCLDALGASDFGLYNVVGGIVTLLNVVNAAMLSTTYRFIAYEVGRQNGASPNKVFNTSLLIHAVLAVFIVLLALTVGDWYIHNYLNVAEGKLSDALFVFHISVLTTAISTLFVPFQGLQVAYENFKANALIDITSQLLKLAAIYLFIYTDGNRIRTYSLIMMSYSMVAGLMYVINCSYNYKEVVKLRFYKDLGLIKKMISYAFWTMFGALASVGKSQGSAVVINYFFGTIVNAAFAVANQVESFVLVFARSLNSAAVPQITKGLGSGNDGRSLTLACYISKYTFILMSMVSFPILLEMDFILGLWLKEVPEGATSFCRLMMLCSLIGCLGEGIPALVNATGNIKLYQVITHSITLLGLPISFALYKMGLPPTTILIVFCAINFLLAFIRLFLLKRIYQFDVKQFFTVSYVRMFAVSIPLVFFYSLYNPNSYSLWGHVGGLIASEVFLLVVVLLVGFDSKEKQLISSYFKK